MSQDDISYHSEGNFFSSLSNHYKSTLVILVTLLSLSGCVTVLVAGAIISTVDVLTDRRTVGEYIDDGAIELSAGNILLSSAEIRKNAHLKIVSLNGILLVTGSVTTEALKQDLVQRFGKIQGVRQVVDESDITDRSKFLARSNDAWISSQVKSRLLLKTGLKSNRIKVTTTRGNVYLMGVVTPEEADKATEHARVVRGVKRVVRVFEYEE